MFRAEIVANRSVQEEIQEGLESATPCIRYTILPEVQGRGRDDRKLGTTTWPELNFVIFAYVEDEDVQKVKDIIAGIKVRFPNEGIRLFLVQASE